MSTGITSTATVLKLRGTRDRIIDLLGVIGETYPIRDLPVASDLIVPFSSTATIRVEGSEKQVAYALCGKDEKDGIKLDGSLTGSGDELKIVTPPIVDDITFTIRGCTALGREADLLSTASVRVGLDVTIAATLTPDMLAPWLIDFDTTVTVLITSSQDGVDYHLVRLPLDDTTASAQEDNISDGDAVRGTGGPIKLPSVALQTDSVVRVRATKTFDKSLARVPDTNVLDVRLPVFVRADTRLSVVPVPVADYNADSFAEVEGAESGVDYRSLVYPITDAMFAQGATSSDGFLAVPVKEDQLPAVIRLPDFDEALEASKVPAGFSVARDWLSGNGANLRLTLPPAEGDELLRIAARKTHSTDSGQFESFVWLKVWAARLVKPNPDQPIVLTVTLDGDAIDGMITVSDGQPGVYYTLWIVPEGSQILPTAYFHQADPLGKSPFKGIEQMKLEVDFVVTRDGQPPLPPQLAGKRIPVGTELAIVARKAQSLASVDFAATATIWPVPNVALDALQYQEGAGAQVKVPASRVGDSFAVYRAGTDESEPESPAQDGNGQLLTLASGPVSPGTTLVLIASSKDLVQVRRRVPLPLDVVQDP